MEFRGICTPAITPLDGRGRIDWDGFATILEHLVDSGVNGIIIGGTTGEYYAHSTEERLESLRRAKEIVGSRVAMIGGTGAIRTEDSVAFAEAIAGLDYDALLVTTPPYASPTPRENALHALAIDRAANLPIMLYNYPGRMAAEMSEECLDRVGRSPNFCAIKESSGDINRLHLLARDYPHIQTSCGMDDQALEFFAWGRPPGSVPDPISRPRRISRCGRPVWSMVISPLAAKSCRRCCRWCAHSNRAVNSRNVSKMAVRSAGCWPVRRARRCVI